MPANVYGQGRLGTIGIGAAGSGRPTAHDVAARMLDFDRARSRAFAPHDIVVNDMTWSLLLGLFVAHERGRRLSLQALCAEMPGPNMVLMRWLRALRASGLIEYGEDEGPSAPVRLSELGEATLRRLIEL